MRAVRGGKGIVDVAITERRESRHRLGIVLLLTTEEARVFDDRDIARLEFRDRRRLVLPVDIMDGTAEHGGIGRDDLVEREFGAGHFRAPEMRENQHDRAAIRQLGNGRQRSAQPRVIADMAVGHRHIQILTHQHALAADVAHVVETLERRHSLLALYRNILRGDRVPTAIALLINIKITVGTRVAAFRRAAIDARHQCRALKDRDYDIAPVAPLDIKGARPYVADDLGFTQSFAARSADKDEIIAQQFFERVAVLRRIGTQPDIVEAAQRGLVAWLSSNGTGHCQRSEQNQATYCHLQCPYRNAAIALAVSTMRFEKPHSLSYQLTTRTSLPSITAVSRLSIVDDAGLCIRSIETSGSSL